MLRGLVKDSALQGAQGAAFDCRAISVKGLFFLCPIYLVLLAGEQYEPLRRQRDACLSSRLFAHCGGTLADGNEGSERSFWRNLVSADGLLVADEGSSASK